MEPHASRCQRPSYCSYPWPWTFIAKKTIEEWWSFNCHVWPEGICSHERASLHLSPIIAILSSHIWTATRMVAVQFTQELNFRRSLQLELFDLLWPWEASFYLFRWMLILLLCLRPIHVKILFPLAGWFAEWSPPCFMVEYLTFHVFWYMTALKPTFFWWHHCRALKF